jgi:hypothetical protein
MYVLPSGRLEHVYIYIWCVCVYVCMYIYIYIRRWRMGLYVCATKREIGTCISRLEHVYIYIYGVCVCVCVILFASKVPMFTSSTTKYFKKKIFY